MLGDIQGFNALALGGWGVGEASSSSKGDGKGKGQLALGDGGGKGDGKSSKGGKGVKPNKKIKIYTGLSQADYFIPPSPYGKE